MKVCVSQEKKLSASSISADLSQQWLKNTAVQAYYQTSTQRYRHFGCYYAAGEEVDLLVLVTGLDPVNENAYFLKHNKIRTEKKLYSANSLKFPTILLYQFCSSFLLLVATQLWHFSKHAKIMRSTKNYFNLARLLRAREAVFTKYITKSYQLGLEANS